MSKRDKLIKKSDGVSIFSVWYRAVNKDTGEMMAESSNLHEIVQLTLNDNVRYLQKVTLNVEMPWGELKKKDIPEVEPLDYGSED